ncbi:hypothetical protein H072_5142 [Dactylellina haptotyla CBS 200.50]|uniref:Uncharacterized protein n=1 Tax=Dactylellina haptotyla (strain CBS 200.50) TaxID=1284197 RepID=S8C084_DACHA|nr:hypothetical protein H072_5142 [Dactylellina haptotyla CBS 200.50]
MVSYNININNKSGSPTAFCVFTHPPKVDSTDSPTIYTNVFQKSHIADSDDGQANFTIDRKVYAICLTSSDDLKAGTNVQTSEKKEVIIGDYTTPASIVQATYHDDSGDLDDPVPSTENNSPPGGFVIKTAGFKYPTEDNFCIGIGTRTGGKNIPLAVFPAKPNTTYNIFPVTKFYVTPAGSYEPGDIIDVKAIGQSHLVNFTGSGKTTMNIDFANDGQFYPASD